MVRVPEEASSRENAYDYVLLCIKALPDVYDLAAVIESVVTPQHTCILVNTTNTIGVESYLEQRFPTNVILSLVSGVEISQTGPSEFEHLSSSDLWVGATSKQSNIPSSIQNDMAVALADTLASGQVDCQVSRNIRQEQFDRMIGYVTTSCLLDSFLFLANHNLSRPIAFQPATVLFDSPKYAQLLEKVGVRQLVSDVIDELVNLARTHGCEFSSDYSQKVIDKMAAVDTPSPMHLDFQLRRPLEVETFLGSPIKLATESDVRIPRIETLYAMLHHTNAVNLTKPANRPSPTQVPAQLPIQPPPRLGSAPPQRMNGPGPARPGPIRTSSGMMPPPRRPMMRPPGAPAAQIPPPGGRLPRDASVEGLEEFSHLMLYDDTDGPPSHVHQNGGPNGISDMPAGPPSAAMSAAEIALRERELAIRQRELQVREQEMGMRRGGGGPGGPGSRRRGPSRATLDEEDEDDFFDPMDTNLVPQVDPDSVDMMSLTGKRNRKGPSASQLRKNPEITLNNHHNSSNSSRPASSFSRYFGGGRKRTSERILQDFPGLHDSLMDNPMMSYSSNRYGAVDRNQMQAESRANSITSRMGDFPPHPYPPSRRNSHSPAAPFGVPPGPRMSRPMPGPGPGPGPSPGGADHHQHLGPPNGPSHTGNPSPPHVRAPVPRYPPGHGNAVGPQQVEQHYGVSNPIPAKGAPKHRSLTGSASASAKSGDSGSGNLESENSAQSSQLSFGAQQPTTATAVR